MVPANNLLDLAMFPKGKTTTIFSNEQARPNKTEFTSPPIRSSIFILVAKVVLMVTCLELGYAFLYFVLTFLFQFSLEAHQSVQFYLFVIMLAKNIAEFFFLIYIVLSWATTEFYLEGDHLITKRGILHSYEDVFNFNIIRSVEIDQSVLGKIFHYGNIILRVSGFGGYQMVVSMLGVPDPEEIEEEINERL